MQKAFYKYSLAIIISCFLITIASAQQLRLSDLQSEFQTLQESLEIITGKQEENQHEILLINQRIEKLLIDIDIRLRRLEDSQSLATQQYQQADDNQLSQQDSNEFNTLLPSEISDNQNEIQTPSASKQDINNQYTAAYRLLTQRKYAEAQIAFEQFINQYPEHLLAANAAYWLAETHYVRQDYANAARSFLTAHDKYPEGSKRFDSLLKLALSLKAANEDKAACQALQKLLEPENEISKRLENRAQQESSKLKCNAQ